MSIMYKHKEEVTISVDIGKSGDIIMFDFYCDGGKFGTTEYLNEFHLSAEKLLEILTEAEDDA